MKGPDVNSVNQCIADCQDLILLEGRLLFVNAAFVCSWLNGGGKCMMQASDSS